MPNVVVTPAILTGFSDSYGFSPFVLDEGELFRIHGNDERISLENARAGVRAYSGATGFTSPFGTQHVTAPTFCRNNPPLALPAYGGVSPPSGQCTNAGQPRGGFPMKTLVSTAVMAAALAVATVSAAQSIGPSTTTAPYVLPSIPGVDTTSILTVGDSIDGYEMVGIPDGLGAFNDKRRTFTLLMNHEIGPESGAVRAHGSTGAFVSRWRIDRKTLEVKGGQDQTPSPRHIHTWVGGRYVEGTTAFNRLCSADLPARTALSHRDDGTRERIVLNGEETRPPFSPDHGRAFAHIATGR